MREKITNKLILHSHVIHKTVVFSAHLLEEWTIVLLEFRQSGFAIFMTHPLNVVFCFQLGNLERKWQHLEQNNFVMKEFIASKTGECDFRPLTQKCAEIVQEYNQLLIKNSLRSTAAAGMQARVQDGPQEKLFVKHYLFSS